MTYAIRLIYNENKLSESLNGGEAMRPIHERIEEIRKAKGVTKTHIARKCNRTVSWYHGISTGRRKPNVESLQLIANALEVDVKVFFENDLSDSLNKSQTTT